MSATKRRLRLIAGCLRPDGCYSAGTYCERAVVVGDGSANPPLPRLPTTCPDCGRPTRWQLVVVAGVDVDRL